MRATDSGSICMQRWLRQSPFCVLQLSVPELETVAITQPRTNGLAEDTFVAYRKINVECISRPDEATRFQQVQDLDRPGCASCVRRSFRSARGRYTKGFFFPQLVRRIRNHRTGCSQLDAMVVDPSMRQGRGASSGRLFQRPYSGRRLSSPDEFRPQ